MFRTSAQGGLVGLVGLVCPLLLVLADSLAAIFKKSNRCSFKPASPCACFEAFDTVTLASVLNLKM